MKPTTVEVESNLGNMLFLNCGSVTDTDNGIAIMIDSQLLMLRGQFDYDQKVAAAQKFADLLTDVTE